MTLKEIFFEGFLKEERNILSSLKAVSLLSLYVVNSEEEYESLFPEPKENAEDMGQRVLNDMVNFEYFKKRKINTPEGVLAQLNKIRVYRSIYKHCHWIGTLAPDAYIKGYCLVYPISENGQVVRRKISLFRLFFKKPKNWVECMLEELRIKE